MVTGRGRNGDGTKTLTPLYIFRYIYHYFLPRYMDRHSKRYFFGKGKYTVTPTVTIIIVTA